MPLVLSMSQIGAVHGDYGINLSNTCLTMLKNNVSTDCPNYEQILTLFPDTSNQKISGHFIYKEGILQRQEPQYEHHFKNYDYDNIDTLWIDPPGDVLEKVNLITITSNDFTYKIPNQIINNFTLLIGQGRYISPNCDKATITAKNWLFLLGDTMKTMKENCSKGSSNFDEIKILSWEKTKHDITTSYKWKLEQWIKESLIKCKGLCFEY